MNLKNLKNFKKGVQNLSSEQQLVVAKYSGLGGFIGLSIALVSMVYTLFIGWSWRLFGFSLLILCVLPMQWIQYSNARNQLKQIEVIKNASQQIKLEGDEQMGEL